jgi:hypothetical protein
MQKSKYEKYDAFVTKMKGSGKSLEYSTYLGGNYVDEGRDIAVDGSGNIYVMGETSSTDFPVKNPVQERNAGGVDVFVTKIKGSGKALAYSTYLGGYLAEKARGIAADGSGNAYVTGYTTSTNYPVRNAFQESYSKSVDAFVTKIGK